MTNQRKFPDWMTESFSSTSKNAIYMCPEISEIVGKQKQTTCSCFFPKRFSGKIKAILETSGKNFWQKAKNLALNVFEWFKVEYLFKKPIFIKMFPWAQRMHSRRLWQKLLGKRPLTLCSVSLKHLKLNYLSKHSFSSN